LDPRTGRLNIAHARHLFADHRLAFGAGAGAVRLCAVRRQHNRKARLLRDRGVIDRCNIVAGSFFETVPEGADAYLMRVVIHDWEDDEAVAILKVCRRAMPQTAKLLLVERLVGPRNEMPAAKFSDLNMLVSPGERERTHEEFSDLFAKSGFELTLVVSAGIHNVIEARQR